jgi:hypothetical protein
MRPSNSGYLDILAGVPLGVYSVIMNIKELPFDGPNLPGASFSINHKDSEQEGHLDDEYGHSRTHVQAEDGTDSRSWVEDQQGG